jgi:hypothetical protein
MTADRRRDNFEELAALKLGTSSYRQLARIARAIGMNGGANAFGSRANATIGRAIRLIMCSCCVRGSAARCGDGAAASHYDTWLATAAPLPAR